MEESDLGSIQRVTADQLPILSGLSIKRLVLNPARCVPALACQCQRADLLHLRHLAGVRARQLQRVLVVHRRSGEMFHIDSGSLHHIENIGRTLPSSSWHSGNERPEDFGFGAAFGAMTDAVLGNTYDLPASDFAKIRRDTTDRRLAARTGDPVVPPSAYFNDPHKFAVEAQSPPLGSAVGSARLARVQYWPALKDLSMYSLRIREDGMREPHWHPITAEMGYVATAAPG